MSEPLTTKRIEHLKPKAETYEVADGGSGLRLRVTPAGRKVLASQRSVWEQFFAALNRVAGIRQA